MRHLVDNEGTNENHTFQIWIDCLHIKYLMVNLINW